MNTIRLNQKPKTLTAMALFLVIVLPALAQIPDIKANGADDSITLDPAQNLSITISLQAGNRLNETAQWWIAARTPSQDWIHLDVTGGTLDWRDGLFVTYQGGLADLQPVEVLNRSGLTEGTHLFYFAVSIPMSDDPARPHAFYHDSVSVNISGSGRSYAVVDTGQVACYDHMAQIDCPAAGEVFYGQDAQYSGNHPRYTDNQDGTVTDHITGMMWQQGFAATKLTYAEAVAYAEFLNAEHFAGYNDWRLPTIKQLYTLIDFRGTDPHPDATQANGLIPFIDTHYFQFEYGDTRAGERIIDSQWASSTLYTATPNMMFGVNFADGRIKGYSMSHPDPRLGEKTFYVRLCRGNSEYGNNRFIDNGNGTVTDEATGLMWMLADSEQGMTWKEALAWAEFQNSINHLGYNDWRLPDAKELHSIVDYTRSPDTTHSAAIDPVFSSTAIRNEAGQADFPYYWTSTTQLRADGSAADAIYVAFGRGLGAINNAIVDIHGAGCQRSDPKDGDIADFPTWGFGPQGDVRRVFNHVRLVRDVET